MRRETRKKTGFAFKISVNLPSVKNYFQIITFAHAYLTAVACSQFFEARALLKHLREKEEQKDKTKLVDDATTDTLGDIITAETVSFDTSTVADIQFPGRSYQDPVSSLPAVFPWHNPTPCEKCDEKMMTTRKDTGSTADAHSKDQAYITDHVSLKCAFDT